jgi:hypothetical protein
MAKHDKLFQQVLIAVLVFVLVVIVLHKFVLNKDNFSPRDGNREDTAIENYYTNSEFYASQGRDTRVAETLCLDKPPASKFPSCK